jgi:hypothetical protein
MQPHPRRAASAHAGLSLLTILAFCLTLFALAPVTPTRAAGVIYVKPGGNGDGSSWANARDLAPALATATNGDELWVAAGRYTPTVRSDPADPRSATFQLQDGVAIYGGFAGNETARDQRAWLSNVVTLSGDLNGDDGPDFANNDENSYHVVSGANNATLDGVTITAGNASRDWPNLLGFGGGMSNAYSSPTLSNVTISGNRADHGGGGMYNRTSSPTLSNVTISGNYANYTGGGMYNYESSPTLSNVTISGNHANNTGGGMYNFFNSSPTLHNSIIWGNTAALGPAIDNEIMFGGVNPVVSASLVEGSGGSGATWIAAFGTDGGGNLDADPRFVAAVPTAPSTGGNLRLQVSSPALNAGSNALVSATTDLDGQSRIVGGTVDMGAYEVQLAVLSITRAGANPTNAAMLEFSVSFNMPVSGVDSADFVLVATDGQATATISAVSGSAAIWTVTVNTVADAAGTLGLNLVDNDTIVTSDSPPVPLGGAGASNGNFVGEIYDVDREAPSAPTLSGNTSTNDTIPTWNWTAGGGGNGTFRYQLNDAAFVETDATSFTPSTALSEGSHTLAVQERDDLGNWSPSGTRTIVIDTTAPSVVISTSARNPTSSSPIPVTVTFSENVSGFTADDLTLTNATLSNFSGSGATYSITLTPLAAGPVTVSIAAGVAADAAGNLNRASAPLSLDYAPNVPVTTFVVYLPLVSQPAPLQGPDLVVEGLDTADGQITLTIANIGDTPVTMPFWVDLLIAPRRAPTHVNDTWDALGSRGLSWGVTVPLAPGQRLTLTVGDAFYRSDYSRPGGAIAAGSLLYAHVDAVNTSSPHGGVRESHEVTGGAYNNILGPVAAASTITLPSTSAAAAALDARLPAR